MMKNIRVLNLHYFLLMLKIIQKRKVTLMIILFTSQEQDKCVTSTRLLGHYDSKKRNKIEPSQN